MREGGVGLVVLGASLGGLEALRKVLAPLPADFPPVAVALHRSRDSGSGLASMIGRDTALVVGEAEDKEPLSRGRVYLAPPDYHLLIEPGAVALSTEGRVSFARPSIDVLFETAAHAYAGRLVGVLLTAASKDGVAGIAAIHRAGGLAVIQDPETAESPIAPRAALRRTRHARVVALGHIGKLLVSLAAGSTGDVEERAQEEK